MASSNRLSPSKINPAQFLAWRVIWGQLECLIDVSQRGVEFVFAK